MTKNAIVPVKKAELLSSLSYALDLTEGQSPGHSVRCCWIGMHIGYAIGIPDKDMSDLFYTLLLKDIGCSSNAARICQLYMTDDLHFKKNVKTLNDSLPQVLRFVLKHTGMKAGMTDRLRSLISVFAASGSIGRELIETRCQRGAEIVRRLRFSEHVAQGILDLDEHWNGKGQPLRRRGDHIALNARIALVAQVVDVFHTSSNASSAAQEVARRAGSWFDPAVAAAFTDVARQSTFWSAMESENLKDIVIDMIEENDNQEVDEDYLDEVAAAFADVVDSKSPFTAGHSRRVTLFTDIIGEELGRSDEDRRFLKRTALLHDIGKLGISNQILDKPGKPDEEEWASIRSHPALSEAILSKIKAFSDLARIAGAHHERLDGKGYPRGLKDAEVCKDTRILTTADVFDALTADRPYRAAIPVSQALSIMRKEVGLAFDALGFDALVNGMKRLESAAACAV